MVAGVGGGVESHAKRTQSKSKRRIEDILVQRGYAWCVNDKARWARVAARIRAVSTLKVTQFELGPEDYDEDMLEVIDLMGATPPPDPILEFYAGVNGLKLMWQGTLEGAPARGSINVVSLLQSSLRVPLEEDGEPLEGVLWTKDMPPERLRELKRMAIFEAIAGTHAFLTYYADEDDARLYLVDDRIRPLATDFSTTIDLLDRYAGADGLRELLVHDDWRERIERDPVLRRVGVI